MDEKIDVGEAAIADVDRVAVLRHGDQLVMMVDGEPYRLSRALAIELAYTLCSQIESMDDADSKNAAH